MRDRAKVATRGTATGPDVRSLKDAAAVTREMARRYVSGLAVPRDEQLQRIAAWLEVDALWLRDGVGGAGRLADEERELLMLFRQCHAEGKRFVMKAAKAALILDDPNEAR